MRSLDSPWIDLSNDPDYLSGAAKINGAFVAMLQDEVKKSFIALRAEWDEESGRGEESYVPSGE